MDTDIGLGDLNIFLGSTSQYREAEIVFQKWHRAAQQWWEVVGHRDFLSGRISRHIQVPQGLRQQQTVVDRYLNAQTSRAFFQ